MRAQTIGIGEGWRFVGVERPGQAAFNSNLGTPLMAVRAIEELRGVEPPVVSPGALEAQGFDVHVNRYGRVFVRDPGAASIFQPKRLTAQGART